MSSAARKETSASLDFPEGGWESGTELKQVAAERLAAHRSRRAEQAAMEAKAAAATHRERSEVRRGAARVRDAVTARYKESVSYREFLAAEAERALQQAQAEAEVAARNARAVAEAQLKLLEELEHWKEPGPGPREAALEQQKAETRVELAGALADIALGARELMAEPALNSPRPIFAVSPLLRRESDPAAEVSASGLTVRLYEELGKPRLNPADLRTTRSHNAEPVEGELSELQDEIDFRFAPEFQPTVIETTPIPANLIEFPRQLIAARKARPRLAEGPLREEAPAEPQLRIFEVAPEQISEEPLVTEPSHVAEWQTLLLDSHSVVTPEAPAEAQVHFSTEPQTAPLELRLMAAAVDSCCLAGALLGFAAVTVAICGPGLRHLSLPLLGTSAAVTLGVMFVVYQMLFFSLAEATPGMRYARIALCTFADDNPSRKAMRRRVLATLLAASPLALGLAWAFLDDERMGWHDRMSRMYQRAY